MKRKTTSKLIIGVKFALLCAFAQAQGLENVIVEKYYISNAADAAGSVGVLPVGSVTYRLYVDMLPHYQYQGLYGVPTHTLTISTSTLFFNNEDRGATTPSFTKNQAQGNTVMLDSWFSAGGAASNQLGVMKADDDGVANAVNSNGILQNNDVLAGIPLTTQDGFLAGTPSAVTFVGINNTGNGDLGVFDGTSNVGNLFTTNNGTISCLAGVSGPDTTTNKVLIGQFTTDGDFHFELNIQIRYIPSTGPAVVEQYVAQNPTGTEQTASFLTYTNSLATVVPPRTSSAQTISVYPNPVTDKITVDVTDTKKFSYRIFDVVGKIVAQKRDSDISSKHSEIIDIASFSKGVYFIECIMDGKTSTRKFVKN